MVLPDTISFLKKEIKRLEALPQSEAIRENLERLKKAVRDAEDSMEATEDFYERIKSGKGS